MLAILDISNGYQILGLLHIVAAVVAFGPLFLYPALHRAGETRSIAKLHTVMVLPALVLLWVLGMGMVGMSDEVFKMSQTWIVVSLLCWAALMLVSWFLVKPALTDTSEAAKSKLSAGVGVSHLLVVVALVMMIFKPGL